MKIILLIYLISIYNINCKEIIGKWKSILITENLLLVDSAIKNISNFKNNSKHGKVEYFGEEGLYNYYDELNNMKGSYLINESCDSLIIYSFNKKPIKIEFRSRFTLVNPNLLLIESLGRHGIVSELLIRIK